MGYEKKRIRPELLAPAGSPLALDAAIEGGADAIYVGGLAFNARINAKNFTLDELKSSIARAHSYGVKVYVAANTLILDREREEYLRAAEAAYLCGADALIVADVGIAREIKKRIPIELHGSTQLSGHNLAAAEHLAKNGFSRMVCAREMSRDDLATFCKDSPIESEVFVHGALCVCHSGQCLFSSLVGGRSGNRGECAQPCRLPYRSGSGKQEYPLSLKDLSLAEHITELCAMGVSSFKIEGRMKSPEYVRDVVRIWRRLLDEGRDASPADMRELAKIFSRGGFTDGYYKKRIGSDMLGVRSDSDKRESAAAEKFEKLERRLPIELYASIKSGREAELRAVSGERSATVKGAIPEAAINAPLTREAVEKNLSKLGATCYSLEKLEIELDEGLMMPISALNALRRAAVDALGGAEERSESDFTRGAFDSPKSKKDKRVSRTALFYEPSEIPKSAESFFDGIFVPLERYSECVGSGYGVMLPEVIFDSERAEVEKMLRFAAENGAERALVGNLGHAELARAAGLSLVGDFRLNCYNNSSAAELERAGFEEIILSPELTLAQMRDIGGRTRTIVYGRLPLMITEKCVGKELGGCGVCEKQRSSLVDRKGVEFPVRRRPEHRSVIFNSVPIYMGDRADELRSYGVCSQHFVFSIENSREIERVIELYSGKRTQSMEKFTRIRNK